MQSKQNYLPGRQRVRARVLVAALLATVFGAMPAQALVLSATPTVWSVSKSGSFLDTVNFDVAVGGTVTGSAQSFDMPLGLLHIRDLSLALYDGSSHLLGSWSGSPSSFVAELGAGSYRVEVGGNADGLSGGYYMLGLASVPQSIVSSIPEPETWLAMIGGLVLLGLRQGRRA